MSEPVVTTRLARTSERLVISVPVTLQRRGERTTSLAQVSSSAVVATKQCKRRGDVSRQIFIGSETTYAGGDLESGIRCHYRYCLTALAILVFAGRYPS